MSDIALKFDGTAVFDLEVASNDIATDDTLETAIFLSLFTDRRASDEDQLPEGEASRRGWWGDVFPNVPRDRIGSKLWLLGREKQMPQVVPRAQEYARDALQWLIEDRVAERVDVEAAIVSPGVLGIGVTVRRPAGDAVTYRYNYTWAAQAARRA